MNLFVAFLLVLSITSLGTITPAQSPSRRASNSQVNKPRTETLRVCQGLPIPDGYVIIAYMTSSACPHGAYLLKKQDDYESSLAVNGSARKPAEESTEPASTSVKSAGTNTQSARKSKQSGRMSAQPTVTARQPGTSAQPGGDSASPAEAIASITRPRRVGASQSPDGPPSLIGGEPARPLRPPTLANAGNNPVASQVSASPDAGYPPGPEEVGEGDVVRVETTLVTVPVSVLDRQGRFVPNLKREDFTVLENGVEQSIAYFEPAEKPFTVALLLDTSASTHFHLNEIKEAAIAFAKQLRPQDRVLIVSFNDEVLLLTPEATNDLNLVETVIGENAYTGNSTRLYDAVDLTITERLNKIKGRKAIVLFTDGVDTSSNPATYESTLREVEELDALIYPIQYDTSDYLRAMQNAGSGTVTVVTTTRGPFGTSTSRTTTQSVPMNGGAPIPGTTKADYDRADKYLHALADKTGGRLYEANDTGQLAQAFSRIAEELRRQYTLGYYPKTDNAEGNDRHQIRVRVRQPNLAVKARDSYVKSATPKPNK